MLRLLHPCRLPEGGLAGGMVLDAKGTRSTGLKSQFLDIRRLNMEWFAAYVHRGTGGAAWNCLRVPVQMGSSRWLHDDRRAQGRFA